MKSQILVLFTLLLLQDMALSWRRRRRRRRPAPAPPPPPPRNCGVSAWSSWRACSHLCGNAGTQARTRTKTTAECCGGTCTYHFSETRSCNRDACQHGGTPVSGSCRCTAAWRGTCCEIDVDECLGNPCQHNCHNVPGSYTCSCQSCYSKSGSRCNLQQCKINGACYLYGQANPGNSCQECQQTQKTSWTNNNALQCSDGNLCTRNDKCENGVCKGTPFTCRTCESCDGTGCVINPGFCVVDGTCYTHGHIRSGKHCQQCDSNNPTAWTANNNLPCSDNNVQTRNDRCLNGECRGEQYTCLPCQEHYNDACRLKNGYCVIKYNDVDTCYSANANKPANTCQWCQPERSTSTWTKKENVPCDDGEQCTRLDTCQNGQCKGTSFSCDDVCQYCNGSDCSLFTGYGYVNENCTCNIAGNDYNHQVINEQNQCQWCDLYDKAARTSVIWSNRPAVACDDGNACTRNDICETGQCVGIAYTCQSSYPQSSCVRTSECVGDGTCRDIMKASGIICRAASDQCDQPERCNGVLGACPPQLIDPIQLQNGDASLTAPSFLSPVRYQSSTDTLYLKLDGFTVDCGSLTIRWLLLNVTNSCSLNQNNAAILPNSNNHALAGLSLQHTEVYKIVVMAADMRGNNGLPICSDTITVDTSQPTGGWIRDGLSSNNLEYQSTKSISAVWGGFTTIYGIAKYELKFAYTPMSTSNETTLMNFINIYLNASFTKTFPAITDGSKVLAKARAFTKAGLFSEIISDGVIVDTSPPQGGSVFDGHPLDIAYANWTDTYQASWTEFIDPHSPIVDYKFGVQQKNGGLISSGLTSVGVKYTATLSNLNLVSSFEYCAIIDGVNTGGLSTLAFSNCVTIDHDAPRPGAVRDGATNDIDYQSATNVLYANWDSFDDRVKGSGIGEYKFKIEDKVGNEITSWNSSGLQTNVKIEELSLSDGETYFVLVRCIDKVGHYTEVKSDGVYIDTTHPVYTGKISLDGETEINDNKTIVYVKFRTSLTSTWPQFIDEHSGIMKYQWEITENNQQPSQSSWKNTPGNVLATSATFQSLVLNDDTEYRLHIRGINNAGLHTDIQSDIFVPLSSAPGVGLVSDGANPNLDIDYQTNASGIYATWNGFETRYIKTYYFAAGSCTPGNYHVTNNNFTPVQPPLSTSFGLSGLSLVNGQRYCIKLKAENLAGVQTEVVSSDGVVVDVTPPNMKRAKVLDGSGDDDINFQSSANEIFATWSGTDDPETGIHHFEIAVSRNRVGEPDVTSYKNVGLNTSGAFSNLNLANDVYYVVLCAINKAGLISCLASDGVLIDPTPPSHGVVHDGIIEPDIRYQSSTTKMSANWEQIWDLESRVDRFEWGIGSSEGNEANILDFLDVGLETHVQSENLTLRNGHSYTVFLNVHNRAGGVRKLTSDGVTIDNTPPIPSDIVLGVAGDHWMFNEKAHLYYSSTASHIYASWNHFSEPESEIWYYQWSIGTSRCGTQVQPFINIGFSTSANTTRSDVRLRQGVPYYISVIGTNRANLVSRACSNGIIFDRSPPVSGVVKVVSSTGERRTNFNFGNNISVQWEDFEDHESGIKNYEISLESNNVMLNYTMKSTDTSFLVPSSQLLPGKYDCTLRCTNNAGLSTSTKIYFILDHSSPVYSGAISSFPRYRFESCVDPIEIKWEIFEDNESAVIFYEVGAGTNEAGVDTQPYQNIGLDTEYKLVCQNLEHNKTYYVKIKAFNTAGLHTFLLTDVIRIDKTAPTGANDSVIDGLLDEDVDFISLEDSISAHWKNMEDLESGIEKIEYCVGSTKLNCVIKPFVVVKGNKSIVCHDCKLSTGVTFYVILRVTNAAGLSSLFTSDGATPDSSPPKIGDVYDGERLKLPDVQNVNVNWTPTVTWYGAQDLESGIRSCEWRIVMHSKSKDDTVFERVIDKKNMTYNIPHTMEAEIGGDVLYNNSFANVIECWNRAGMSIKRSSNGWSVVNEWPVTSYVWDGTWAQDLEYDILGLYIGATWGPFLGDLKDPVIQYEWAIGTHPGLDDVMSFTEVGLATRVSQSLSESDIDVEPGVRNYVTVKATSLSGSTSNKSSNGFIVDTTPPKAGSVSVKHEILDQKNKAVELNLFWEGFEDNESGIKTYEYCLGKIQGVCHTRKHIAAMTGRSLVSDFIPCDYQTSYYAIVVATNTAGLKTVRSSAAFQIDITEPIAGTVHDGIDDDWDYVSSTVTLATTWSEFDDPDTGIDRCILTLMEESLSQPFYSAIIMKTDVNSNGSFIYNNVTLASGLRYRATVECRNPDKFSTIVSSDGVIVDDTPPSMTEVLDGTVQTGDIDYQSSVEVLNAHWLPARDDESGLKEYRVAIGSGSNVDDTCEFFSVGLSTEVAFTNLTLVSAASYYVTLEIVNNAGLRSRVSSDGVIVDNSPPVISNLRMVRSSSSFIGGKYPVSASWSSHDVESNINHTEYCVGTTAGACQVQDITTIPRNITDITCSGCSLKHKYKYHVTLRVWNHAGLFSAASTQEVQADMTAPINGQVEVEHRYIPCDNHCKIAGNLKEFSDNESGIESCDISVMSSHGSIVATVITSLTNEFEVGNVSLEDGGTYKLAVSCINTVGIRSSDVHSSSITVDNSPPEKGRVIVSPGLNQDLRGQHSGCHFFNNTLRVFWSGFSDPQSEIAAFRVGIGRRPVVVDIVPYNAPKLASHAEFMLEKQRYGLSQGDIIYATVEAINKAGMKTTVSSLPTRLISESNENLVDEHNFECLNV